jgi:transmembrane sensor
MTSDILRHFKSVRDQAAYWVVLLHTLEYTAPILPLFCEWLDAGPTHRPEFLRLDATWRLVADMRDRGLLTECDLSIPGIPKPLHRPLLAPRSWKRPAMFAAAVTMVILLVLGLYPTRHEHHASTPCGHSPPDQHTASCRLSHGQHAAGYGESATLDLVDGTVISLDSNSQVTLDVTEEHRAVRLDRGEALFHVTQEHAAPFLVSVGDTIVTSLGTTFSVEREGPDILQTVVVEGRVVVQRPHQQPVLLEAGQVAEVRDGHVRLCEPTPSKLDTRLFWTAGLMSFNNEPLSQVAQRFNRYNQRKLKVDGDIADLPIGGMFASNNPEGFAKALQRMAGIEHIIKRDPKTGEETIYLHGKSPSDPSDNTGDRKSVERSQEGEEQ